MAAFLVLSAVKLWIACTLSPFGDEAFYWQESRHPAWGYSDLPPLTAWLVRLGEDVAGHGAFGMRSACGSVAVANASTCAWLGWTPKDQPAEGGQEVSTSRGMVGPFKSRDQRANAYGVQARLAVGANQVLGKLWRGVRGRAATTTAAMAAIQGLP